MQAPRRHPQPARRGDPATYCSLRTEMNVNLLNPGGPQEEGSGGPWGLVGGLARDEGQRPQRQCPLVEQASLQSRLHNVWSNLTSNTIEF